MFYQATVPCEGCGQRRLCLWVPTGSFRGMWRCGSCEKSDSEALADIVKAMQRRLERRLDGEAREAEAQEPRT